MGVDISGFQELFAKLRTVDLVGQGPPAVPGDLRKAVQDAAGLLPLPYRDGYVAPLLRELGTLAQNLEPSMLEAITGAIYDHATPEVAPQLHQFLAVISNCYRSFLSDRKRSEAGVPRVGQTPPLAMFQHVADFGPYTLPADATGQILGSAIGVVSLPSVYRDHPLLWPALAHETGGHDILHADADLLPELSRGVQAIFGGGAPSRTTISMGRFLGLLWSHWIDEAASDVYGVLNIGPSFALNQAILLSSLNAAWGGATTPALSTVTGHGANDPTLDVHPTDILRLDLVRGAVDSLGGLAQHVRDDYTAAIDALSAQCGGNAATVTVRGVLPTGAGSGMKVDVPAPMPLMRTAARTVGSFIATARLDALDKHSVQEIETWDDGDEAAAQTISAALGSGGSADALGDDAQLLAGATLAAFAAPGRYEAISAGLASALTVSWQTDPIWSVPGPEPVWITPRLGDDAEFADAVTISWA